MAIDSENILVVRAEFEDRHGRALRADDLRGSNGLPSLVAIRRHIGITVPRRCTHRTALADLTGDAFERANAARGRHRRAAGICGRRFNVGPEKKRPDRD
ncbi:MAG: hypothetical protein QOF69_123 [Solirubrobacteraceae bacterium]|nr:hypothetical protein [Solirubrobacteraceae bacterium]